MAAKMGTSTHGQQKRDIIAATALALKRNGIPPMDERLKSIVATQIGTLLKGGWPAPEIQQAAIDLALAWDERRGHNRMTHLQQRMRLMDAERKQREHVAQMAIGRGDAAELRALLARDRDPLEIAGRPHPSTHDFAPSPFDASSCDVCSGPWGVHVKPRVDVSA